MAVLRRQGLSVDVPRSLVVAGLLGGGSSSLRQMCSCEGVCSPGGQAGQCSRQRASPWTPRPPAPSARHVRHRNQGEGSRALGHGGLWGQCSRSRPS